MRSLIAFSFLLNLFSSCAQDSKVHTSDAPINAAQNIEKDLQSQLILAEDGDTILLAEGLFKFSRSLIMEGKSNILIKGKGMGNTILSFADQTEGAEGIRISNGSNISLADFTVQDAKGDNIKVNDVHGLRLINIKSEWTGEPDAGNGAYALYPVMCENVLIDGCVAAGASDAGIYVGQSRNVIVRNSTAYNNVAGIEIENTINADVYDNEAFDNTGGILVFDLPGLSQLGGYVRVFNNHVFNNNFTNFAPPGNIVGAVPPGTGMMLLATRNAEVFDNKIEDNRTVGIALISYQFVEATSDPVEEEDQDGLSMQNNMERYRQDQSYDPYPSAVYIHHNQIKNSYRLPTFENDIGFLLTFKFGLNQPLILHDGILDPSLVDESGSLPLDHAICIMDNGDASIANLDAEHEFKNVERDPLYYQCDRQKLPAVELLTILSSDE